MVPAPPAKKIRTSDYDSGVVAPEPPKSGTKRRIAPTVVSSSAVPPTPGALDRDMSSTPTKAVETLSIGQENDQSLKTLSVNAGAGMAAGNVHAAKSGAINVLQAKSKKKR